MGGRLAETFMVGEWRAARALNTLERDGQTLQIEPISMDVLVLLAEHAGEVVSIDELIETIWKGRATDGSVYRTINQLRKALEGDDEEARYIQTIRKRGYRLIAQVTSNNVASNLDEPASGRSAIAVSPPEAPDPASIAVLPFENISPEPENAFFADGMHGEVLSQLAKISALKVISRTSVLGYRSGSKNIREIAQELGVGSILEGTVQRAGGTARINVQLIDAARDEHIWAQVFDRKLSAENVFSIQSEIATAVASALHASLLPQEVARLKEVPTQNAIAYDFYLSGNAHLYNASFGDVTGWNNAIMAYQRTVEEDPNFALAWAALSRMHALFYSLNIDRTASRIAAATDTLDRARNLAPDLAEIHLAAAVFHYRVTRDCARAFAENDLAARGMPGAAELAYERGLIYRRLGYWKQALEQFDHASTLDPRNVKLIHAQAWTHCWLRDYELSNQHAERICAVDPKHIYGPVSQAIVDLYRDGDVTALKNMAPFQNDWRYLLSWTAANYERDYDSAFKLLDSWKVSSIGWAVTYTVKPLIYGVTLQLSGRPDEARPYFEAARIDIDKTITESLDYPMLYIALGEALAGLGKFEQALAAGRQALTMRPTSTEPFYGPVHQTEAALRVFIPAGDYDSAIGELDCILGSPAGGWTIEGLLPDPRLDPIRDHPRFLALVEKHKRQ